MSQEEESKTPAQPAGPEETGETTETPAPKNGKPKSKSRPVTVYLSVLFCVALLLLAVSFVMQQRNHMALQDLNESLAQTQGITELKLENQRLQYELEDQKETDTQLKAQLEETEKQVKALEWLRQIEAATRRSFSAAQELAEAFEATGLKDSLPTESVVEGADSPADTYESIYNMLF